VDLILAVKLSLFPSFQQFELSQSCLNAEELFVGIYVVEDEAQRILMQQPANFNL